MKNNQVLKIGQFGDHDLARLALRERLTSMLQFGRLSLKEGEVKPRYDVKADAGKGVITRADGTVVFEASLESLVESGKQVRLALVGFKRLLRERGILQFVRDNRDLQLVVNTFGNEVVLLGFDGRTKQRVQRYKLTRDVVIGEVGVRLTTLPRKLADAAELGSKIEANFLQQLDTAKQTGDANKVAQLEDMGAKLGIFKLSPVRAPKPQAKAASAESAKSSQPQAASPSAKSEGKPGKKRRRGKRGKGAKPVAPASAPANAQPAATPAEASAVAAPAAATSETKKKRRRRRRNRKPGAVESVAVVAEPTTVAEPIALPAEELASEPAPATEVIAPEAESSAPATEAPAVQQ